MPSPIDYLHFQSKMQPKGVAIQRMGGDHGVIDTGGDAQGIVSVIALTNKGVI